MSPGLPTSPLKEFLEQRLSGLVPELETWVRQASAERETAARSAVSEHLNRAMRLMREASGFEALSAVLLDATAQFAAGAAVFRFSGNALRGERVRGLPGERSEWFAALELPASAAACFAPALETGDPAVALGGTGDVAGAMLELQAHSAGDRICIFPIMAAGRPEGFIYAWGAVDMSAMELLAQAAGLVLASGQPRTATSGLVEIAAAAPAVKPAQPSEVFRSNAPDWECMAATEREIHLRAQRFARVQVAELRLYRQEAITAGRARRDLYGALREPIDAAREAYRRQFLKKTPGVNDYLHEELLHTLANDDSALLGPAYPGPLS